MFEELKLKCRIRQVANNSYMNRDDKMLFYINMFECEPKKKHDIIKNYIHEFDPDIWDEFNEYITIQNMTNIIKSMTDKVENSKKSKGDVKKASTLEEVLKKIKEK